LQNYNFICVTTLGILVIANFSITATCALYHFGLETRTFPRTWLSKFRSHKPKFRSHTSSPHSQAAEAAIPHWGKQERKRLTPARRRLRRTHAVFGRAIPGGWVGN